MKDAQWRRETCVLTIPSSGAASRAKAAIQWPPMLPLPTEDARLEEGEARRLTDEVKRDAAALWRKLVRLHDGQAHQALGYSSWHEYCAAEFGIRGKSHAYRLLDAGRVVEVVPQLGNGSHARELAPLLREEGADAVTEVFNELRDRYGNRLTADKLRRAVTERMRIDAATLALVSSASNEWYTPSEIIEAAREVLGGIDLDPASSALANETVRARRFYTEADDGLTKKWRGRVWLNPPYGGLQEGFITKLIEEHEAGRVPAAIMLLNGYRFDARWFVPLWDYPLCFLTKKFRFRNPYRPDAGAAPTAFVAVYVGREFDRFREVFGRFGAVMKDPSEREWPKRFSRPPGSARA
jgi:hypothetical protein